MLRAPPFQNKITTVPDARDTGSGKEGSPPGALTPVNACFPFTFLCLVGVLLAANAVLSKILTLPLVQLLIQGSGRIRPVVKTIMIPEDNVCNYHATPL